MQIISPITNNNEILIEKEIQTNYLCNLYLNQVGVDVSEYFTGIEKLFICKCVKTEFRFYFPLITGNQNLYKALELNDWYYQPWKWEYEKSKKFLFKNCKVLEIGCGNGAFLNNITNDCSCTHGIEFNINNESLKKINPDIQIFSHSIEEHTKQFQEFYDIIFVFQVLEHIADVNSFINACKLSLKKGGLLIIGVPNNHASIVKNDIENCLNFPPHHLGLWDKNSLKELGHYFDLKRIITYYEPLQTAHSKRLYNLRIKKLISISPFMGRIIDKLFWKNAYKMMLLLRNIIHGHTVLTIYKK